MKYALHYEQFCGDVPAPAWSELPPAINERRSSTGQSADSNIVGAHDVATSVVAGSSPVAVQPSTERDDAAPPFKVGDKCMFFGPMSHEWRPTEWNASHGELTRTKFRHPTPAELAEHWPDEWIPCTDEAQRLALGDARVNVRWLHGVEWDTPWRASRIEEIGGPD